MSIQISPIQIGFPLQTATSVRLFFNNLEVSTATTTTILQTIVYGNSGFTQVGVSNLELPPAVFSAFTHNAGNSGITTVENYVLATNGFSRA